MSAQKGPTPADRIRARTAVMDLSDPAPDAPAPTAEEMRTWIDGTACAPPGPWYAASSPRSVAIARGDGEKIKEENIMLVGERTYDAYMATLFIAMARYAMPRLIRECIRLRRLNEALQDGGAERDEYSRGLRDGRGDGAEEREALRRENSRLRTEVTIEQLGPKRASVRAPLKHGGAKVVQVRYENLKRKD